MSDDVRHITVSEDDSFVCKQCGRRYAYFPQFKIGDRVWCEAAGQFGTITAKRPPTLCSECAGE